MDPYREWLEIRSEDGRTPNHYELLGLSESETDVERIQQAARDRSVVVRAYQLGKYQDQAIRLLGEIARAKLCLSHEDERRAYDQQLKQGGSPVRPSAEPPQSFRQIADDDVLDYLKEPGDQDGSRQGPALPPVPTLDPSVMRSEHAGPSLARSRARDLDGMAADLYRSAAAAVCQSCHNELPIGSQLCSRCGFDLRTGKHVGVQDASTAFQPAGRCLQAGLLLVYWGSRLGFGVVAGGVGLGLLVTAHETGLQPGVPYHETLMLGLLGLIYTVAGTLGGMLGERLDSYRDYQDELDSDVLGGWMLALASMMLVGGWAIGRTDVLFNSLLLVLVGATTAVVIGVGLCFAMSEAGLQKLFALCGALGYAGGAVLILLTSRHALSLGSGILMAAMGEIFFLLWLRELSREVQREAAVDRFAWLLLFVAFGTAIVVTLALAWSDPIQDAFKLPPAFTLGSFVFFLCAALYALVATVGRLRILQALLD